MRLKRLLPRGLFARAFLIVALPVLLLQGVTAFLLIQRHFEASTRQMAQGAAREIALVAAQIDQAPGWDSAQDALAASGATLDLDFSLTRAQPGALEKSRRFFDFSGGAVAQTLRAHLGPSAVIDTFTRDKRIEVRLATSKGVLTTLINRNRVTLSNPHQLFVVIGLSSLALLAIAVQFLRNQVRPIRDLARAAEAFGLGRRVAFRPHGADEVRRAGRAFLEMRARIERHIASRTRMLSGVSHDMRTPLARMKLAAAMMEETPEREELQRDIAQMENMLDAFLAFARGEAGEKDASVDPRQLAEEAAEDARRGGARIRLEADEDVPPLRMRREAVLRALGNLLANAARHATRVRLQLRSSPGEIAFLVEDDGPGIAPEDRQEALAPFSRLDAARNQDSNGGVGLGLSIAQDVARAHGGRLYLERSEELGGLCARLSIPR